MNSDKIESSQFVFLSALLIFELTQKFERKSSSQDIQAKLHRSGGRRLAKSVDFIVAQKRFCCIGRDIVKGFETCTIRWHLAFFMSIIIASVQSETSHEGTTITTYNLTRYS